MICTGAEFDPTGTYRYALWREWEPRRFRTDRAFTVQLVRRVRALGNVSAGSYYDHRTDKVRRVYRELTPRAVLALGAWITEALGGPGLRLARMDVQTEERKREERQALYQALEVMQ